MDQKLLKELRIQNILKVIELRNKNDEEARKVLDYIYNEELSELQLDVTLFPNKKADTKYNFK